MNEARSVKFTEKKLLGAFGILILITVAIGIIGILQIKDLSQRIEKLGKQNFKLEGAILEMKTNSTVYAMGIRNYVFWRVSRYLGAAPAAINLENIFAAEIRFKEQLKIYAENTYSQKQKEWVRQAEASFGEVSALGRQIVSLIEPGQPVSGESESSAKNLLMVFENRLFGIDKFIDVVLAKDNLNEIQRQLLKTEADERKAILFLSLTLASAVAIGALIALSVYLRRKQEYLYRQQLFSQMINLEENERKNLSAQIHDQLGQDLSALKISLGMIEQSLINEPQDVRVKMEKVRKILSELIEKSHNIAYLLRPPALDEVGLIESIEGLLMDYRHLSGINYTYEKPQEEIRLPLEYNLLIYRLTQELLTNMAKHANAKNVNVSLHKEKDGIEFFYADDGAGFQYAEIKQQPHRRREDKFKLGLAGLRERVELLGGVMRIDAAPGKGTRVSVRLTI